MNEFGFPRIRVHRATAFVLPNVDEGRTGFVFEAGNGQALAALLMAQRELGWAGARFFAACREKSGEFSMERSFAQHAQLWDSVARRRPTAWAGA